MSTVILTPTHIASDHSFVETIYPTALRVKRSHKKLFLPDHKKFVFGTIGNFLPDEIECEEVFLMLEEMIKRCVKDLTETGSVLYSFKDDIFSRCYRMLFDDSSGGRTLIATKHHHLVFYISKINDAINVQPVQDIVGVGSGGSIGAGMIMGGMPLEDIWEPLHAMDNLTSVEHTIIPLDTLVEWL